MSAYDQVRSGRVVSCIRENPDVSWGRHPGAREGKGHAVFKDFKQTNFLRDQEQGIHRVVGSNRASLYVNIGTVYIAGVDLG